MNAAQRMQNALRIMMSLDEVASVIGRDAAPDFHRDPLRAACRMDEATWARVFAQIEARQPRSHIAACLDALRADAASDDGTKVADALSLIEGAHAYARQKGR